MNTVLIGDCLIKLKELKENSVDSIVTDPPYELGFMGKSWDNTGIANNKYMWAECLRVLKPGGHLLAFSGTRTYHRMAVAIEDAGFEVRDMIEWVYGSGFPKSLNIAKAIDIKLGQNIPRGKSFNTAGGGDRTQEFQNNGRQDAIYTEAKSNEAKEWFGWGTALKPAHEPICMARKPLSEKTVAENCLKWGTGGINIDESRVDFIDAKDKDGWKYGAAGKENKSIDSWKNTSKVIIQNDVSGRFPANLIHDNSEEVRECFPETKSVKSQRGKVNFGQFGGLAGEEPSNSGHSTERGHNDSGNASRFFKSIIYQAKASKSERNMGCENLETSEKFTAGNYSQSPTCKDCELTLNGTNDHSKCSGEIYYKEMLSKNTKNNHPTVKPIALMEYLIKMITPKGGIVLDPFAGSGSTLVAAKQNGFNYIGIELTQEYIPIIEARLNAVKQQILNF